VLATCTRLLSWRKSSFCANGECLEVASWAGSVMLRDSVQPAVVLSIPDPAWRKFASAVRRAGVDGLPTPAAGGETRRDEA
jgi:hypothetical protein